MTDMLALFGQCEYSSEPTLGQAIMKAARDGVDLRPLQEIIARRVESGHLVLGEPLATVLAAAPHKRLWDAAWPKLRNDIWSVLILYRNRYPQNAIEETVCGELHQAGLNDANPRRSYIVEAMADVGTARTLPLLAMLRDAMSARAAAGRQFGSQLGGIEAVEMLSSVEFFDLLQRAIREIELRQSASPVANAFREPHDDVDRAAATTWLNKAHGYSDVDPIVAVDTVRKGAEALAKAWYRALGLDAGGKSPRRMMLDELLKDLDKAGAPARLIRHLKALQPFGNFTAHDQEGQSEEVTAADAETYIGILSQALEIERVEGEV